MVDKFQVPDLVFLCLLRESSSHPPVLSLAERLSTRHDVGVAKAGYLLQSSLPLLLTGQNVTAFAGNMERTVEPKEFQDAVSAFQVLSTAAGARVD